MGTKRKPFAPKVSAVDAAAIAEAEEMEIVLTVNGKPIPSEFAHAITYAMTDQGIAEALASPKARVTPGVSVTGDAWDKQLLRKSEAEVWDGFDPLQEAADQVREPGMQYRFISDRVLKRRGRRGWDPVTDKDGKAVQVAGMSLGKMPIERADRRNAHYREVGNDALKHAAEQFQSDQAKAIRDAKVSGISTLRVGDVVADNHHHPGMVTEVGVRSARGAEPAE